MRLAVRVFMRDPVKLAVTLKQKGREAGDAVARHQVSSPANMLADRDVWIDPLKIMTVEADAEDLLTLISLIHRRLDAAPMPPRA